MTKMTLSRLLVGTCPGVLSASIAYDRSVVGGVLTAGAGVCQVRPYTNYADRGDGAEVRASPSDGRMADGVALERRGSRWI